MFVQSIFLDILALFIYFSGPGPRPSLAVVRVRVAASQLSAPGGGLSLPGPEDRGQLVTVPVRGRLEVGGRLRVLWLSLPGSLKSGSEVLYHLYYDPETHDHIRDEYDSENRGCDGQCYGLSDESE